MKLAVIAGVLLIASVAFAERAAPPRPPPRTKPAPRLVPPPRPQPVVPRPPREIEYAGRAAAGKWTCTGTSRRDDGTFARLAMAFTTELDLDNAWIKTTVVDKIEGQPDIKLMQYLTFDAIANEWNKVELDSTGARSIMSATRPDDGVWVWTGMRWAGDGTQITTQVRSHDQSDQVTSSSWAESLIDGKWTKISESSCKRAN